ncbi:hypothetical protein [Desulfatitalea tepidiphila]|uniref:hypothetical protein n=1 Tax=Desulfatitalea tepidiphila TaxID=1185843 RepID=UPI0006B55E37|nr:hypothetical protein [Desulfatitalea tepidiphila]
MDDKERDQIRDHAWKYFQLHADQRIKTFNFYLILCALISGALTAILKDASDIRVGIPLALLLPFLSFIFWKLDLRNKQLIGHGEQALKHIENLFEVDDEADKPHLLKIFNCEDHVTKGLKRSTPFFTYSTCFHLVFLTFGLSGVVLAWWLLGKPFP